MVGCRTGSVVVVVRALRKMPVSARAVIGRYLYSASWIDTSVKKPSAETYLIMLHLRACMYLYCTTQVEGTVGIATQLLSGRLQ